MRTNGNALPEGTKEVASARQRELVSAMEALNAQIAQDANGDMQAFREGIKKGVSLLVQARTEKIDPGNCKQLQELRRTLSEAYNKIFKTIAPKGIDRLFSSQEAFDAVCSQFKIGTSPGEIRAKQELFEFFTKSKDPHIPAYFAERICSREQSFESFWEFYGNLSKEGFFAQARTIDDVFKVWDTYLPPNSATSRDWYFFKRKFGEPGEGLRISLLDLEEFAAICAGHSNPKELAQDPFTRTFLEASAFCILNLNHAGLFTQQDACRSDVLVRLLNCWNPAFFEVVQSVGSEVLPLVSNIASLGGSFIANEKAQDSVSDRYNSPAVQDYLLAVQDVYSYVLPWLTSLSLCNSDSIGATNLPAIRELVDSLVNGLEQRAETCKGQDRRLNAALENHRLQKSYASVTKEQIPQVVDDYFERIGKKEAVSNSTEATYIKRLLEKLSEPELCDIAERYGSQSPAKAVAFCQFAYHREKGHPRLAARWSSSLQAVLNQYNTEDGGADFIFLYKYGRPDSSTHETVDRAVENFMGELRFTDEAFEFVKTGIAANRLILADEEYFPAIDVSLGWLKLTTAQARELFTAQADALLAAETGMRDLRSKGALYLQKLSKYKRCDDPDILDDSLRDKVSQLSKCISLLTPVATLLGTTGYQVAKEHAPHTIPLLVAFAAQPPEFKLSHKGWEIPADLASADCQYQFGEVAAEIKKQFPPTRDGKADDAHNAYEAYAEWAAGQIKKAASAPLQRSEELITFALESQVPLTALRHFCAMKQTWAASTLGMGMLERSLIKIAETAPNRFLGDYHKNKKLTEGVNFSVDTLKSAVKKATTHADPTLALDFLHTSVDIDASLVKQVLPDILAHAANLLTTADDKKALATPTRLLYGAIQLFHYLDAAEAKQVFSTLLAYETQYNKSLSVEANQLTRRAFDQLAKEMNTDIFTRDEPKTRLLRYPRVSTKDFYFLFMGTPTQHSEAEGWISAHFERAFTAGSSYQDYVSRFSELLVKKPGLSQHDSFKSVLTRVVWGSRCAWEEIFDFIGPDMKFNPIFVSGWLTQRVKSSLTGLDLHPQQRAYLEYCVNSPLF